MIDNASRAALCDNIASTIEERGHAVGRFGPNGSTCLLGAGEIVINGFMVEDLNRYDDEPAMALTAELLGFGSTTETYRFSDTHDQKGVIGRCRQRAAFWREKEVD